MKKIILIIIISILLIPALHKAESAKLEIDYPTFHADHIFHSQPAQEMLPHYIRYIFSFAIAISGFIVFASLVYGGFVYITSAGNPNATRDAKEQIASSLVGIVIVLGSFVILNTINPQLTTLRGIEVVNSGNTIKTGVYLIDYDGKQHYMSGGSLNLAEIDFNGLKEIRIVDWYDVITESFEEEGEKIEQTIGDKETIWTVVLHSEREGKGSCIVKVGSQHRINNKIDLTEDKNIDLLIKLTQDVSHYPLDSFKTSSITVFAQKKEENTSTQAIVYSGRQYQDKSEKLETITVNNIKTVNFFKELTNNLFQNVWSIKVPEDKLVLLAQMKGDTTERCQLITNNFTTMEKQYINQCNPYSFWRAYDYESCATHYITFQLKRD